MGGGGSRPDAKAREAGAESYLEFLLSYSPRVVIWHISGLQITQLKWRATSLSKVREESIERAETIKTALAVDVANQTSG